jgi:hypothetical protein
MKMDKKRLKAGTKLLIAAQEFWDACRDEGQGGAVQWLEGSGGQLLIYTRGEYRQHLMQAVHSLPSAKVHFFQGEVIPQDEES